MNLLGLRKLIGDMLSSPARPSLRTEDVLNVDFVNPLEKPGPWALDVLVNDGTGTDATRTYRVTVEEKREEPTFAVRLTRAQVLAILQDAQQESFPALHSTDEAHTLFFDMNNWWKKNRFVAQYRAKGGEWVTTKIGGQEWETAWDGLADEMQRRGLRHSELGGEHGLLRDVINGEPVTAEDGTEFRILKPGQGDAQ